MTAESMAKLGLALLFKDAGVPVELAARLAFDDEVFAAVTDCGKAAG